LLPFLTSVSLYHPDWSMWPVLPFAAWLVYAGLQTPKRIARRRYGKMLFPHEYTAEISKDGIVTHSPTVRTELKWTAFSFFIESTNVVALIYEAVMYVFPRRAFSDNQWREFMQLIRERVPCAERQTHRQTEGPTGTNPHPLG
jgi:hypothetical protein